MIPTPEMKEMRAFHGSTSLKEKYIKRVKQHKAADEIIKGTYWEKGKGCAVGCTVEVASGAHAVMQKELGIPEAIAHVEDYLFEAMPNEDAKEFPLRFLEAIPVGADLSLVSAKLICYMLDDTLNNREVQEDGAVKKAVQDTLNLWKRVGAGEKVESAAWSAAWSAAESAARSAARSAAESAARSAAESAARSAAWSAAESAAWSAARSAAESAARSAAWSAAESAAWSAAESAAAKRYGDALIRFLAEAPVPDPVVSDDVTEEAIALLRERGYKIVKE